MPKTKAQKQETVSELKQSLAKAKSVVFVNIQGLKAKDLVVLRRKIKEVKGIFQVAKKTLINLAFGEKETKIKELEGEIAVAFATDDELSSLKSLYNFSKENENLKLVAGIFGGSLAGKEEILTLAQLPTKQELLARLVGSIASPMSGIVNVLQGNLKGLVYLLSSIKK